LLFVAGLFRFAGHPAEPVLESPEIHAISGEPARVQGRPRADGRLTVVSWNVAQGTRYDRVLSVLKTLDADIYLLQEVDMNVRRSDYREVASDLAGDLGLNWIFAGEFQEIGQSRPSATALTGQAVLSRYPIENASVLRFEHQARLRWTLDPLQPRAGGRMALRAESGGVLLYNAHIESAKNDEFRHRQIDEIVRDHALTRQSGRPVIIAGDFNTGLPPDRSPVVRRLTDGGFVDALGPPGAPRRTSARHANPLDWIFVRNLAPQGGRVVEARNASDHFPLEAAVSFASPSIGGGLRSADLLDNPR
jgi:endonuclease/exonuclease/phosphatase family metal-dependent hydrolase